MKKFVLNAFLLSSIAATTVSAESTSLWDVIPGASQLKSLFQLAMGDHSGAAKTWTNFLNEGVGTSQARSAFHLVTGDSGKAWDIQKKFASNLEGLVDGAPLLGHIKGAVHLMAGDKEHGWNAIKSATTSTGTMLGGVFFGPFGAVSGHVLADSLITAADYAFDAKNSSKTHGIIEHLEHFGEKTAGEHFDVLAGLAFDGLAGSKVKKLPSSVKAAMGKAVGDPGIELQSGVSYRRVMNDDSKTPSAGSSVSSGSATSLLSMHSEDNVHVENAARPKSVTPELQGEKHAAPQANTPSDPRVSDLLSSTALEVENEIKASNFYGFLDKDQTYAAYDLEKQPGSVLKKRSFDGLTSHAENAVLNKLSLRSVKNSLTYLSDSEKSLLSRYDFRTVDTDMINADSVLSSLAGVLGEDVKALQTRLSKTPKRPYLKDLDDPPLSHFNELVKRRNIEYLVSIEAKGMSKLNELITENAHFMDGKKSLIFTETSKTGAVNSYVMKFKKLEGEPNHAKLFIDYNVPGLLDMGVPNPYRVINFIKNPDSTFQVYFIKVLDKELRD